MVFRICSILQRIFCGDTWEHVAPLAGHLSCGQDKAALCANLMWVAVVIIFVITVVPLVGDMSVWL